MAGTTIGLVAAACAGEPEALEVPERGAVFSGGGGVVPTMAIGLYLFDAEAERHHVLFSTADQLNCETWTRYWEGPRREAKDDDGEGFIESEYCAALAPYLDDAAFPESFSWLSLPRTFVRYGEHPAADESDCLSSRALPVDDEDVVLEERDDVLTVTGSLTLQSGQREVIQIAGVAQHCVDTEFAFEVTADY